MSLSHTDVSLWFAFAGSELDPLIPDEREFAAIRWWPLSDVVHSSASRFDPNLPRFVDKLQSRIG